MIIALALLSHLIITILADVNVYNNDSNKLLESFDDQNARFGPALPVGGVKGYLITTNPPNACLLVSPPPFPVKEPYHWIAIIPRTNGPDSCEFAMKVQNAQAANFSAVIIYNFEDAIIPMGSSSKTVRIPSTMITHSDGISLITHYLYNKTSSNGTSRYYVKIIPEPAYKFGPYVIVAVVIVSVSFLVLIGSMLVRCHIQRRHTRRHRLPRSALKQLKIKKFAKTDPWEVCVICLDDFVEGVKVRILPCNHAYHVKCIDPWLINNRRQCPVCKRYVFPNLDHSDDDESNNRPRPTVSNEHTPLIHGDNVQSTTERPASRRFPRHTLAYPTAASVHASLLSSSDSSESIPSLSSSLRPTTMSAASSQQPLSISRQYGSFHESATTAVHHPILSSMDTTVEDVSDTEPGDDDSRLHSVLADSGENPAYASDEETTHTHL